jgi:hypothetical protein
MKIPESFEPLVQLMENAADGAAKYGAIIKLKQNDEPAIRLDLTGLIGVPAGPGGVPPAIPGLKSLWNTAKSNKTAKTAGLGTAEGNGRALATMCIASLKPVLGNQWNSAWNAAGFVSGSLAVPAHPQPLLILLSGYYTDNPAREVKAVNGIDCTAVACTAASDAIVAAQTASNRSNTDAGTAQSNLQDGINVGRARMTGLQAELGQLLDDNDPRWLAFGFDLPGHTPGPDVPQNLTVTAGAAGSHILYAHCDDARGADGYRFQALNPADATVVLAQVLTQDAEATFDTLASGTKVNLVVSARNTTGESQASAPPVLIVVP